MKLTCDQAEKKKGKNARAQVNVKLVTCWLALFLEYIEENLRYDNSKTLLLSTSLRSDNYLESEG